MQPRRASWRRKQLTFCLGGGHRTWVSLTSKWGFIHCLACSPCPSLPPSIMSLSNSSVHSIILLPFQVPNPSYPELCTSWYP